NVDCI
ncbi:aspartate kinase III domain protein, partial [Vibrio parahaemolyticus VPTS-2010]